jgi:rhodanese-related sulfurtransferase
MSEAKNSGQPDQTVSREELRRKLERGGVLLLDAQAPGWYEREHLPGAQKIPEVDLAARMREIAPGPDSEIVVYCWSEACMGSEIAAQTLRGLGYRSVRRYVGGKKDWMDAGLAVVTILGPAAIPCGRVVSDSLLGGALPAGVIPSQRGRVLAEAARPPPSRATTSLRYASSGFRGRAVVTRWHGLRSRS